MEKKITVNIEKNGPKEFSKGATPLEIAKILHQRELDQIVSCVVDSKLTDLRTPLLENVSHLKFLKIGDEQALEVIRHSAEHILAEAVKEIWVDTQIDVGRKDHSEKFHYDFFLSHRFRPDDLSIIQKKMEEIIARGKNFEREELARDQATRFFSEIKETFKIKRIEMLPENQPITVFKHGAFTDLCRGPHVLNAKQIGAVKLLDISGAYWRGDESNPMLQRILGTAFYSQDELKKWIEHLEEAKKRDHRILGKKHDFFSVKEEVGPGLILWHPRGSAIRKLMEEYWIERHLENDYKLVTTPHVGQANLWETSGHLSFYNENMFPAMDVESKKYFIKPMNCPFHVVIYSDKPKSYKDLPLKLAELGTVYRYEKTGVLHGMLRVRGFTQDDSHIFCTEEQVEEEVIKVLNFAVEILLKFGFSKFKAFLATKPEKAVGDDNNWEIAIEALQRACKKAGIDVETEEGGGAFYGPKIDIHIEDSVGRFWQCSTIQFDFNLPERFDIGYVGKDNNIHRPFMIHRAIYGSIERFFGILTEHYKGNFPMWLMPIQVEIIPINSQVIDYAKEIYSKLKLKNMRVKLNTSEARLSDRIKESYEEQIPYALIIGKKELENKQVSVRSLEKGDLGSMSYSKFQEILDAVL